MRWTFLCLLAAFVATCGQTGPLTLPEKPQAERPLVEERQSQVEPSIPNHAAYP